MISNLKGLQLECYLGQKGQFQVIVEKEHPIVFFTIYDNAPIESFYKTLKRELVNDAKFESPANTKAEIFKYIETYYNTRRMHSSLGYVSPAEFEKSIIN